MLNHTNSLTGLSKPISWPYQYCVCRAVSHTLQFCHSFDVEEDGDDDVDDFCAKLECLLDICLFKTDTSILRVVQIQKLSTQCACVFASLTHFRSK